MFEPLNDSWQLRTRGSPPQNNGFLLWLLCQSFNNMYLLPSTKFSKLLPLPHGKKSGLLQIELFLHFAQLRDKDRHTTCQQILPNCCYYCDCYTSKNRVKGNFPFSELCTVWQIVEFQDILNFRLKRLEVIGLYFISTTK